MKSISKLQLKVSKLLLVIVSYVEMTNCNCKDNGGKVLVHQRCRRNSVTDSKRKILEDVHGVDLYSKKVKLRSQQTSFNWKSNCFLCGRDAIVDTRHPDRNDVQIVATILSTTVDISTKKRTTFREKILNICMHRSDFLGFTSRITTAKLYRSCSRGSCLSQVLLL